MNLGAPIRPFAYPGAARGEPREFPSARLALCGRKSQYEAFLSRDKCIPIGFPPLELTMRRGRAIERRRAGAALIAPLVLVVLSLLGTAAWAADPATELSEAESRAASATAEVAAAQEELAAARADHAAASRRARPLARQARVKGAEARLLRTELADRQRQARAQVAALEEGHEEEEDEHDEEVAIDISLAIAGFLGAAIAIGWGRFRASAPVAKLAQLRLAQALGLCLGGGLLLFIAGAVLAEGEGVLAVLGWLFLALGFLLPTALLLARHSLEVERGNAKPLLKRDRLPAEVRGGVAALLLLLAFGGLGSALFAEEPTAPEISTQLRKDLDAPERGRGAEELKEAQVEAEAARKRAVQPLAQQRAARAILREATGALSRAKGRLVAAQSDARRFGRRLAALEAREARQAERQAEREAVLLEEIEEEEAEEFEEIPSGCDPNYSGCVPPYPPDVDCAEVGGTVASYGSDPHGLDADGDGSGCE
jgi:hypothetical protein